MWYFSGFNGFGQFGKEKNKFVKTITNFHYNASNQDFLITPSWSCNVVAIGDELTILGYAQQNHKPKFKLPKKIIALASTDNYCLVLLDSGTLFKVNKKNFTIEEVKFNCKQNDVATTKTIKIDRIACGNNLALAITNKNSVLTIHNSNKIIQFPNSDRIVDLQCGFEHAVALSSGGRVYTWGNGLRGQLGIEELGIHENPILNEALDGIKIISIAAGGWHSAAVSLIGDLYTWGYNCSGQLGIRVFEVNGLKNTTVYPLPQLIDLPECADCEKKNKSCNVIEVYSGARHTIVRTSCGSILGAGWNQYGQLGLADERIIVDELQKICELREDYVDLICGPWCTIFKIKN